MGLKYIEPIKSIILLLLIGLSITFTFSIWTHSPKLDAIEQSPTVDISIGEQKKLQDIIKPYKFLIKYESSLNGTTDEKQIDAIIKEMNSWRISQLVPAEDEMKKDQMKAFFEHTNQFTFYFQGEVPLSVYQQILPIDNGVQRPGDDFRFDRLVVRWNPKEIAFEAYFINRATGMNFRGKVLTGGETMKSYRNIVLEGENFPEYNEVATPEPTYLAVPTKTVKMNKSRYVQEELSPTRFRDALFNDPNAVRRSQVDAAHEEFGDDHALLVVNTVTKMLNFVHPAAESREPADSSTLLLDVIDSINEHGGWTDPYRYSYINSLSRVVKFQLYNQGYPVFSEPESLTEIAQYYGENRVFRYIRPYYTLDVGVNDEVVELPSGTEIANALLESEIDVGTVEDITTAYTMRHDTEDRSFVMEPAWYYLMKERWHPYTADQGGGEQIGLE
jgi:regulatory protein YycH of two-component signal transduction system YycFG